MGDPMRYLPKCTIEDICEELSSVGFPPAQAITQLSVEAAYHKVFHLKFSPANYIEILERSGHTIEISDAKVEQNTSFILRISGSHVPEIKTANEIGILTYLVEHTTVPVPRIIHYDAGTANCLQNEYMVMTLLPGSNGSNIYQTLTQDHISSILDQLAAICLELYHLDFTHIGGLRPDHDTTMTAFPQQLLRTPLLPGPPLMETMWQSPDINEHFNKTLTDPDNGPSAKQQSLHTLNAISSSGYESYSSWLAAQMRVYLHAVRTHPSLHWILDKDTTLTALTTFTTALETDTFLQFKLNSIPLKLAHRDLHFGNIVLSPEPPTPAAFTASNTTSPTETTRKPNYKITGILDWEFAAILPFPLWRHSFLRDGVHFDPTVHTEVSETEFYARSGRVRDKLYEQWTKKVAALDGGKQILKDMKWQCKEQEKAWDVVNYLRCIVEVCPRGVQLDDARGWWREVVGALDVFGIKAGG